MDSVKIGIIGSGFIAEHHAEAYSKIPNVKIIGLSSILEKEAKIFMKKHNISGNPIKDYKELLSMDCDAVSICLPNFLHKEVAVAALNAGKHILIEKPLARTAEEGKEILNAARKSGKEVYYCENNLYAPSFSKVKEIVDQGALGQIYMGRGKEQHSGPHSAWQF